MTSHEFSIPHTDEVSPSDIRSNTTLTDVDLTDADLTDADLPELTHIIRELDDEKRDSPNPKKIEEMERRQQQQADRISKKARHLTEDH
jgi:hypothetical protein